jgi:hypothetical protein
MTVAVTLRGGDSKGQKRGKGPIWEVRGGASCCFMKKLMALIALAGLVVVGCAHKEKNMGGSSDQSATTSGSDWSNPSKNYSFDTNNGNLNNPLNNPPQ